MDKIGIKEIEVGFPAASDTEYNFVRKLIEEDMIPDDVTIQVLTQAREHIIRKTFESIEGAPNVIVHMYNSTSVAQRNQVFKKDKDEIKKIAIDGAKLLSKLSKEYAGDFSFQYSPESFSGTEVDYALEVCNAVLDVWKPTKKKKVIINIPTTVENAIPHIFASQLEYIDKNIDFRDEVILCIHPHNDRGSSVSTAELGLLAGADRVEGTLFGNGERTGNLDIVTLAMNMYSHGIDPGLDFSNMPEICDTYERLTGMVIDKRQPYAGELVFTAFSGSHQDAISKGIKWREKNMDEKWSIPYLPIDPADIGREYESDVIRINSQSGKGGVSYILNKNFGMTLPEKMKEDVGYMVKDFSDRENRALSPEWVFKVFEDVYINDNSKFKIPEYHFKRNANISAEVSIEFDGSVHIIHSLGNGRLDAVSNAIKEFFGIEFDISFYEEHSMSKSSTANAVSYVGLSYEDKIYWGVGISEDIINSSVEALIVAANRIEEITDKFSNEDARMNEILRYMQDHYETVTLTELSDELHLSKPYISKYIKEKRGENFGEIIKRIRMNKAKLLLKTRQMNVEDIAIAVGYNNVEHFTRLFKKENNMTPIQFRNSK